MRDTAVTKHRKDDILDEAQWSATLAANLIEVHRAGRGAVVTWYNHHSLQVSLKHGISLEPFDYIGIDGFFLRRIIAPKAPRTSADLVLPLVLTSIRQDCRVALIGGDHTGLQAAAKIITSLPSEPRIVLLRDGFKGLPTPDALAREIKEEDADVVVLGLGSPRQDSYAVALAQAGCERQLIFTCGGWLDQISNPGYYPAIAYRLKVNWLFRLMREPSRLWRRYTIQACRAIYNRKRLRSALLQRGLPGFTAMVIASTELPKPALPNTKQIDLTTAQVLDVPLVKHE